MIRTVLTLACVAAFTAGVAGAAGPKAAPAAKAAEAQKELSDLKNRIAAIQKRIAEAEESKNEAADALQASERAISDATREMSQIVEQAREANAKALAARRETERIKAQLERERRAAAQVLYEMYAAGKPDALAIVLNGRDANGVARELTYLGYIARARAGLIDSLEINTKKLEALTREAEAYAAQIAALAAEQTRQRKKLEQEKRARAEVLARIAREIEQQRREIGTLKRDETRLTRLIDELARLIARAAKPRPPRDARPTRERADPPVTNERIPEPADGGGLFASLRGRLALPVRGELAHRFGSPRQDGGVTWRGLFIAARPGEEVRAVAAGRVVFADWLRGFGNLLIIDHGESYMSLYGYNETLYKQVGDSVRSGDRIAAIGNTGGHPESGLYFEMRHQGRPFDPMSWVSRR